MELAIRTGGVMAEDASMRINQMNDGFLLRKMRSSKAKFGPVCKAIENIDQLQAILEQRVEIGGEDAPAERSHLPEVARLLQLEQRCQEKVGPVHIVAARAIVVVPPTLNVAFRGSCWIEYVAKKI